MMDQPRSPQTRFHIREAIISPPTLEQIEVPKLVELGSRSVVVTNRQTWPSRQTVRVAKAIGIVPDVPRA